MAYLPLPTQTFANIIWEHFRSVRQLRYGLLGTGRKAFWPLLTSIDQFYKSDVKWIRTGANKFEGLEMEKSPSSKYYFVSCLHLGKIKR